MFRGSGVSECIFLFTGSEPENGKEAFKTVVIYIYIISINLRIYKVYNIIVKDIAFLKKKTKTESCVVHNTVRVTVRETKKNFSYWTGKTLTREHRTEPWSCTFQQD